MLTEALRIYTIVVSSLAMVIGTWQSRRWLKFLPENQLAWLAVAVGNLAFLLGTIESMIRGLPGGFRVPLTSAAVTFVLMAVCYRPYLWVRRNWWRVYSRRRKVPL